MESYWLFIIIIIIIINCLLSIIYSFSIVVTLKTFT